MEKSEEIKRQKKIEDDPFIKELHKLMEKNDMRTFYFYGENLEGWCETFDFSNLDMMKLISRILFEKEDFETTREVIISDVLRYMDPQRITKEKNDKGELIDIPFIPSVYMQED